VCIYGHLPETPLELIALVATVVTATASPITPRLVSTQLLATDNAVGSGGGSGGSGNRFHLQAAKKIILANYRMPSTDAERAYARAYYIRKVREDPEYRARHAAKVLAKYHAKRMALVSAVDYQPLRRGRPAIYLT